MSRMRSPMRDDMRSPMFAPMVGRYAAVEAAGLLGSEFDGTSDDGLITAGLTGAVDSKEFILSAWITASSVVGDRALHGFNGSTRTDELKASRLVNRWQSAAAGETLQSQTDANYGSTFSDYKHILISGNMAVLNDVWMYADDADELSSIGTFNDLTINWERAKYTIAAYNDIGGGRYAGKISEFYFNTVTHLDLDVEANRRLFNDGSGKPVLLGADGSTPTGSQPIVYCPAGDPSDNKGSGGNLVISGAIVSVDGPGV